MISFNDAPKQREGGDLIPEGTIVPVRMTLRPGNAGHGGWLKPTNAHDGAMLDCEFTVLEGPFAKRKFWSMMLVEGNGSDGHTKAVQISKSRIRAILESARGINPADDTDRAMQARAIETWGDLDGLEFVAKTAIEKSKDERYGPKTVIGSIITPDIDGWAQLGTPYGSTTGGMAPMGAVVAGVVQQAGAAMAAGGAARPKWG